MVLFNIIPPNSLQTEKICAFLIDNKFALYVHIDHDTVIGPDTGTRNNRIFFITRALLYPAIEQALEKEFGRGKLIYFTTPVIQVNNEMAAEIRDKLG